ncbi:MAG: Do family serine endopeptidase [Candidatus Aminicenantes bacterium]|nr:Do family serine endopeptidase [Candidatus Aminicenantes bacterium]
MKKVVWISLASFLLGILLAGYVFVYLPEKKAPQRSFLDNAAAPLGSSLFADIPQAIKPDLDFVKISDKVGPAVFKVECDKIERQSTMGFPDGPSDEFWNRFFGSPQSRPQTQKVTVQGTGFFISADGYAITNNHIVENGQKIKVFTVQGDEYQAKIIGTDPRTDVALIKIEAKNLPFAELGDSAQVKVGEWVVAIGNPLGMEHTVTAGIVSAKGRQLGLGDGSYEDFIQTDAAINRGNSGGPLVNMKGEVIGINSNILTPTGGNIGIGFAIPVDMAKKVVGQLKDKGKVVRGWLGVEVATLPIDQDTQKLLNLKSKKGALINNVTQGGPAEKAGFKPYDVIVEVNGQAIENSNDLRMKIADIQPGTNVEFKVIRDGKEKAVPATIAELEEDRQKPSAMSAGKDVGLTVTALTANLARRYGIRTTKGLLITDVDGESDAARKGLQPGDIILEVNREIVTTEEQWNSLLSNKKSGEALLLRIRREGDGQSRDSIVTIKIP